MSEPLLRGTVWAFAFEPGGSPTPAAALGERLGALSPATMRRVDAALRTVLSLE